jgi:hypothetical protein
MRVIPEASRVKAYHVEEANPLGVFINIDDHRTHADQYYGRFRGRLHFLAVRREGEPVER